MVPPLTVNQSANLTAHTQLFLLYMYEHAALQCPLKTFDHVRSSQIPVSRRMESLLFRTGSGSISVQSLLTPGSPRHPVSLPIQDPVSGEKNGAASFSRISLHMEISRRSIRRSSSEPDLVLSDSRTLGKLGSRSFSLQRISEEDCNQAGDWPANSRSCEEPVSFPSGGGKSNSPNFPGGGGRNGSDGDEKRIGVYYQEMLKTDPTNSLLLRNYGKYLHEVKKDAAKAEEYYGRAILATPGDGEVIALYAKLIWETHRDEWRASSYFNQALQASPDDSVVWGSYAHFLWEMEESEEGAEAKEVGLPAPAPAMAEAF